MKKTLLFIALIGSASLFSQTELVLNGTADDFNVAEIKINNIKEVRGNTGDNADAWDMTPSSTIITNAAAEAAAENQMSGVEGALGETSASPYKAIWNNSALEDALEIKYLGAAGSLDEQPGSTSSGNGGTRGVKLYDDGKPEITGSSRRLYQLVQGLTVGDTYNFSIDSKSEAANTPSEVYILNTEITDETGIDANGYSDSSVVTGMSITNDEGAWTTTTFSFTATTTEVVIYVRALAADSSSTEVFYDNISLKKDATASVNDVFSSKISIYPNPANEFVQISTKEEITGVEVYNLIGKKVISLNSLSNNKIDVSSLSKGMYILKVKSNELVGSKKLVIQ